MSTTRSFRRSSNPVLVTTYGASSGTTGPAPEFQNPREIEMKRNTYNYDEVQQCRPYDDFASVIVFPGDDATNSTVKQYLSDILTKTSCSLAAVSEKEIRATVHSFSGDGAALRTYYAENRMKEICPLYLTTLEGGVMTKQRISASTRSNIGKCITREMERYFEQEYQTQHSPQYGIDGDATLINSSSDFGTCVRHSNNIISEEEALNFRKREQRRATLPENWMSESLRARTKCVCLVGRAIPADGNSNMNTDPASPSAQRTSFHSQPERLQEDASLCSSIKHLPCLWMY